MYDSSQLSQHCSEGKLHPKGSVLAAMAGLIVKVLLEDGALVEAGQPVVMVMEEMKMEVAFIPVTFWALNNLLNTATAVILFFSAYCEGVLGVSRGPESYSPATSFCL
jgi:acetyl/propionyl-CoA carboxylase alpha subunit